MISKSKLSDIKIKDLRILKEKVEQATSKEELLTFLDVVITKKEEQLTKSMNSKFLVSWFNIDPNNIDILHKNGIYTLAQLRYINEDELWNLDGMTEGGYEQISWARDFFDMTPIEKIAPTKRDTMTLAKVMVKKVNACRKKHPNM